MTKEGGNQIMAVIDVVKLGTVTMSAQESIAAVSPSV